MATREQLKHADTVIRNHVMWSAASGAIPIALADVAAVSAVQVDMIRQLCNVFDTDFSATKGKALVSSVTTAALARVGVASVVKMVPIAGTLVGSVTGSVLAGASSFALGQAFKTHLSQGGTFLDIDLDRIKQVYLEQFEKGKETVHAWREEDADDESLGDRAKSTGQFFMEKLTRRRKQGPSAEHEVSTEGPVEEQATADESARASPNPSTRALSERLAELVKLHERGLISDVDFQATKARLLEAL